MGVLRRSCRVVLIRFDGSIHACSKHVMLLMSAAKGRFSGDISAETPERDAKYRQDCRCATISLAASTERSGEGARDDPFGQFVYGRLRDGPCWTTGDVELRFFSGEVFLLADATMTRHVTGEFDNR